jgi:glycosyltransferase involved in cell wall biosynthesis
MKKSSGELCYRSGTLDCSRCFKGSTFGPGEFYLRKRYIQTFFKLIDHFVSPSAFLKKRYVEWGIASEKITVIENGQPTLNISESEKGSSDSLSLCYIGQINPNKGLDVLLEAITLLPEEIKQRVQVDVHGSGLENQSPDYQKKIQKLVKKSKKSVRLHGRYQAEDVGNILSSAQWLIVPSIWWENSPMVIQESLNCGVPLIVSDIGGMAEKVENNVTGLHFRVGKPLALANRIVQIAEDKDLHTQLASNITPPLSLADAYKKTMDIVKQC